MPLIDPIENPDWSGDEYQFLIDHWQLPGMSVDWVQENKPGPKRSRNAIHQKAYYLGLTDRSVGKKRKYLPAIPRVQIHAARNHTRAEIARLVYKDTGIKVSTVWCIKMLMIHFPYSYRRWKAQEPMRRSEALKEAKRKV